MEDEKMGNKAQPIEMPANNHVEVTLVGKTQEIREFTTIKTLKITKAINEHVRVWFAGTIKIPEEITDSAQYIMDYLNALNLGEWEIVVKIVKIKQAPGAIVSKEKQANQDNKTEEVFFRGLVINIRIDAVNGVYDITLEGASYTYKLDIALGNRSFQNKDMTFKQLIEKVISGQAICADLSKHTESIRRLFVQYKVTNWSFLVRMASRQNSGLVADCLESMPKFYFRVPDQSNQTAIQLTCNNNQAVEYQVIKNVREFKRNQKNFYIKGQQEPSAIQIEVDNCDQVLEIGDKVKLLSDAKEAAKYVQKAVAEWNGGALRHRYTLVAADGLKQNPILNTQIAGASVEGKVIAVGKDFVKVQMDEFEFEKNESSTAAALWPFVYASFYTAGEKSGWYCMPEQNDHVKVYFPTSNEENAFVMASIRKEKQKGKVRIGNPNIKYFRTRFEKVLVLGEEEIIITCYSKDLKNQVELRLNDGSKGKNAGLIKIASFGKIAITAGGNLELHSDQNLKISADQQMNFKCKDSHLKLDGNTFIYGNPPRVN
jgi:hypothetical protein